MANREYLKSVKVYELVMNLDGTIKEVGRELSPDEYTVDKMAM